MALISTNSFMACTRGEIAGILAITSQLGAVLEGCAPPAHPRHTNPGAAERIRTSDLCRRGIRASSVRRNATVAARGLFGYQGRTRP